MNMNLKKRYFGGLKFLKLFGWGTDPRCHYVMLRERESQGFQIKLFWDLLGFSQSVIKKDFSNPNSWLSHRMEIK